MAVKIELVCVGNELLIGKTMNTNAHWLAQRCTALGAKIQRITVISDDLYEIAETVNESLKRDPTFIVTTGGLGPTFDDKTLQGISIALKKKLEVNQKALDLVRGKYEKLLREGQIKRVDMTPARMKMATFPEGAEPLPNPVGTAPGMLFRTKKALLIALPGVPPEMEAIFENSIVTMIKKKAGRSSFLEASIFLDGIMESALAPLIDKAMRDNPNVYIKSHVYSRITPRVEGKKSHIEVHFSTTSENSRIGKNCLDNAITELSDLVEKSGGKISSQ